MLLLTSMRIIAAILVLLLSTPFARADMVWHDAYKNPFSSWGAYMYDQNVKRHMRERTTKSDSAPTSLPRAKITATDFKRDRKRKDVVADLVASLPAAEAKELGTTLRASMAQLGSAGRKDNVANAMAIAITVSFAVLEVADFNEAKADALPAEVNDVLAASPQFAKLGAADRQLMYDSLLLSAAVIALLHQSGEKETSQTIARQVLQQLVGVTPN